MSDRRRAAPSNPRTVEVGGFAVAFALVLVVGGVVLAGLWWRLRPSAPPSTADTPSALASAPAVAPTLPAAARDVVHDPLTGVTAQGEPQLGLSSAPVEVIEYGDFQCPNCRQFALNVLPAIKDEWVRTGFVRIVYRDFIVFGADSLRAAEAAHCAGEQGHFWRFHDGLFELRRAGDPLDIAHMLGLATAIGMDAGALSACVDAHRYKAEVEATTQSAKDQGFEGTPTYLINGRKVAGAIPPEQWTELFSLYQQDFAKAGSPSGPSPAP
ncbi:MAG: thioredoxin domain-containing protein [Ardenticatenales bacterium]